MDIDPAIHEPIGEELRWAKRRKRGSCIVCKKKKLVYVRLRPVKCKVCRECYNKNKGPCLIKNSVIPKHDWQPTEVPNRLDVGNYIAPDTVPKNAWFFCTQCKLYLI